MIEIGKKQALMVIKKTEFGVYLGTEEDKVLLPSKFVDEDIEIGDSVMVFVYRDSKDRLIATTNEPYITLGEVKNLKVKQITGIGAFLDWGLEKDLLLPFKEQTVRVLEGRSYPVALYVDKSNRLCATMRIYNYLKTNHQYRTGDKVKGFAYEHIEKFGMFVAIDNMYQGLIPKKALFGNVSVGDEITATVTKILPDKKIELALRAPSYLQIEEDAAVILNLLKENDGRLPFTDKSSPEEIKEFFEMSKAAFKRACGHLYKEKKITITQTEILLNERS